MVIVCNKVVIAVKLKYKNIIKDVKNIHNLGIFDIFFCLKQVVYYIRGPPLST